MSGCSEIILIADSLLEHAKLDEFVAHHIRIRRKTTHNLLFGIAYNVFPILLVKIHDIKLQAIFLSDHCRDHDIVVHRAIGQAIASATNLDIE